MGFSGIRSLDIELTRRCNLDCPYCYLGQHKTNVDMSKAVLDDVIEITMRGRLGKLQLYGGEPLLAFDSLKYLVDTLKSRGAGTHFSVMSNGLSDDVEIFEYCKRNKLSVQRSVDGCPAAVADGRGVKALERYNKATLLWKDYGKTRRSTIAPQAAKYIIESMHYFQSLGFVKGMSPQPDYYPDWSAENIEIFCQQLWQLGIEFVEDFKKTGKGFRLFWIDRACATFKSKQHDFIHRMGCGAGRNMACVSCEGNVYLCHRFSSEPADGPFCRGTLREILDYKDRGYGNIAKCGLHKVVSLERPAMCAGCVAVRSCDSGCYHINYKTTGDMSKPNPVYCRFKQESAKIVHWIDLQLRELNPNWWQASLDSRPNRDVPKRKPRNKNGATNGPNADTERRSDCTACGRKQDVQRAVSDGDACKCVETRPTDTADVPDVPAV